MSDLNRTTLFWQLQLARVDKEKPELIRHLSVVSLRCFWLAVEIGLSQAESKLALAAGLMHDIGKIPSLAKTGFHPLDGANFIASFQEEHLANLVAYHSDAKQAAELLGVDLTRYSEERSVVSDILAVCDMTTDQAGCVVTVAKRMDALTSFYGADSVEAKALAAWSADFSDCYTRISTRRRHRNFLDQDERL